MKLQKVPRPEYTTEFRAQAVKRVRKVGAGVAAGELELVAQTPRNWVRAASKSQLKAAGAKSVTAEQMELSRLCAEVACLNMHVAI